MKKKHNEGFTLVELLVSIVILAAIVLPTCSSLVMSYRLNAKTKAMTQAQLVVSSTVETLMATGITDEFVKAVRESQKAEETVTITEENENDSPKIEGTCDAFPGIRFTLQDRGDYYDLTVMDEEGLVEVKTSIRDKTTTSENEDEEEVAPT